MAWDSTRPVPWMRLVREWLVYVAIMAAIFVVFFQDRNLTGILAGLLASGPLYLGFGYIRSKFGFDRKTLGELRAQAKESSRDDSESEPEPGLEPQRPKPAPTRRTGGGTNRPGGKRRR